MPPRITHTKSNVYAQQGDRVELICASQGFPVPVYRLVYIGLFYDVVVVVVVPAATCAEFFLDFVTMPNKYVFYCFHLIFNQVTLSNLMDYR